MTPRKKPTPQQQATRLATQVMSLPQPERLTALQEGLKKLDQETRDIAEPLVLAAINSSAPIKQTLWTWSETPNILRVLLALIVAVVVGKYLRDAVSVQGKVAGLGIQAGGGAGAFFVVFLLYPPSLIPWSRRKKKDATKA